MFEFIMRSSGSYSWRKIKLIRWFKPPDPTLNVNKKDLNRLIDKVFSKKGRILDLGSGGKKLKEGIINLDLDIFDHVQVVGDAHYLPFIDEIFDLIIITAVLEHVKYPEQVVCEIERCLKEEGMVYAQVPFLQGYHADPNDYQRYTIAGLKVLFSAFNEQEVGVCVGPISVLAWYLRKFPTIFFKNVHLIKGIEIITGWIFFIIKYLDFFVVKAKNAHILSSGLYYLGIKKSNNSKV
ncbi:MAG: class I SAM-dependent methyltransferase [Candidatus Hodarchaeota archaeon]